MLINKNSNISKALRLFGKHKDKKQKHINHLMDELLESKYISRNFQIGVTYVQIAKSTLKKAKEILHEMQELINKTRNESNTSFGRESLNHKFTQLSSLFNNESRKLTMDVRQNLFYNNNNELIFKVFDSSSLEECVLIPKLNAHKLTFKNANIKNIVNADLAQVQINEILSYIRSSEEVIKSSEEKLSKINLTDVMSSNLLALSSNEDKDSIEKLIELTKRGLIKENNSCPNNINEKNIKNLLK